MNEQATLGTLLRHLIETLDGAVEQSYADAGLDYRPRYTPVMRALMASGPAAIQAIAQQAGITHSAASQTVAQMTKRGLVHRRPGGDARQRIVALTPRGRRMLPALQARWAATKAAADLLDAELPMPLTQLCRDALAALQRTSFSQRLAAAAAKLQPIPPPWSSR